jgi:hypothetical protein
MHNNVNRISELEYRIQSTIASLGGTLPERYAIAWHGYLAAMVEWKLISILDYRQLYLLNDPG